MRESPGNIAEVLPVGGGGAVLVLSELESMASRQQREIAQQRRLLEQREARLAVLRGTQEPAQQDRLARLRHRLDQQQTKLNRLRLLRSQTDQSRVNNATLTSDLDCIRALFNEKEKELSLAVAKVEELTRQLEDLRGRHIVGNNGTGHFPTSASAELEKLRRELLYRNKMNEQQNQVVSQQRLALAQKQAEMASIDARIAQLQGRLQRKRALNQRLSQQLGSTNRLSTNQAFLDSKVDFTNSGKSRPAGNIAAIEPYSHIPNDDFNLKKSDPKYQTLPYNTKFAVNFKGTDDDVNINKIQHSASASQIATRSAFQQVGHQIVHSQSQTHIQGKLQPLGSNQQHLHNNTQNLVNQSSSNSNVNTNNNSNNNNNNNNSNLNNYILENQTSSQILRIHGMQQSLQQGNPQQKFPNTINLSNSSLVPSIQIALNQNHRNVQTHQKPVSSVAPSFPVKSPIYQTSSTKIHPVMPQTLSLIGRGHPGTQNYNALSCQSQNQLSANTQSNVSCNTQELNCLSRLNQLGTTHHPSQNIIHSSTYQQSSPTAQNLPSSTTNCNFNNLSKQNFVQPTLNEPLNDKSKFEPAKNQDKFEHLSSIKHESQMRHENGLNKYEQHLKYEQSPKHEQSSPYQTSIYENSGKHDASTGKQEGHTKLQHEQHLKLDHTTKYDHGPIPQQFKQHEHDLHSSKKFDQNLSLKHELSGKYDTCKESQSKLDQVNYEQNQANFDNITTKYEHNAQVLQNDHNKFETHTKMEKPFEYNKLNAESERKIVNFNEMKSEDKTKPTLPPKPSKPNPPPRLTSHEKLELINDMDEGNMKATANTVFREENEEEVPPIPTSEPPESPTESQSVNQQVIKSRPLNLKKVPLSEHPKLKYSKSNIHVSINRRIEMPPAFLFPETDIPADLIQTEVQQYQSQQQHQQQQHQQQQQQQIIDALSNHPVNEELTRKEKLEDVDIVDALNVINIEDKLKMKSEKDRRSETTEFESKAAEVTRRKKGNLKSTTGKANLSRRVSFDPLALLLDASLEGELELVKKTAKEVANPSSANDEGITALHNAICAGHLEIVKFLVEFGCDVNAQDSDGWTPLHCAASCNNLAMVRFLVEHGACIFATTLSDHETAAEKCEEDEEGFDGCSEYLYSVQEKLGIMNNGQVFALFDYSPQHSDELSLKNGDSLVVLRKGDDDEREWWWSKLGHKEGYVPRNLLGLYPRVKPTKVD